MPENCILGCIKSTLGRRLREVILLPPGVQIWTPQHRKDVDLLEGAKRRVMKVVRRMKLLCYEDS